MRAKGHGSRLQSGCSMRFGRSFAKDNNTGTQNRRNVTHPFCHRERSDAISLKMHTNDGIASLRLQ